MIHPARAASSLAAIVILAAVLGTLNFLPVSVISQGRGKVVISPEAQILRSPQAGVIDEIAVHEGDQVEASQVLLRLHGESAASASPDRQKLLALQVRAQRLQAQADDRAVLVFGDELMRAAPVDAAAESESFQAYRRSFESQMKILRRQKEQRESDVREITSRIRDLKDVMRLAESARENLRENDRMQLDLDLAGQKSELDRLEDSLPQHLAAYEEAVRRIHELEADTKNKVAAELAAVKKDMNAMTRLLARQKEAGTLDVVSPLAGTVRALRVSAVGGVVEAGSPLVEIQPAQGQMIIEARVSADDALSRIRAGQDAKVTIMAYDYSIYTNLSGYVADLFHVAAEGGQKVPPAWYVRVRLPQPQPGLEQSSQIMPGMDASVQIMAGTQSMLDFIRDKYAGSSSKKI